LLTAVQNLVINYAIGELILFVADATGNNVLAAIAGVAAALYLSNPKLLSTSTLMEADKLLKLSTEFVNNLSLIEGEENAELAEELAETAAEAQKKIDDELANREDVEAVAIDSQFLAALQSTDTNYFPAIQGNYAYDQTYNYDSLVGNYHNQQLQKGVK